uniref:Nose resistant-to-fluoxetine protein N-terminal domain-containing protein n=1 Tax=Strigamia maritima TaxID=126957 RepID=T1IUQ3_STRMM
MKSLLFLFALSFGFLDSNQQGLRSDTHVTKNNFISQILLNVGPNVLRQYLLGNYSQSAIYRINLTKAFTEILETVKPPNPTRCVEDAFAYFLAFVKLEFWAIQMFDAQGKIPSGLTDGNIIWSGSYVLCKHVVQGPPYSVKNPKPYHGKYCWSEFDFKTGWFPLIFEKISLYIVVIFEGQLLVDTQMVDTQAIDTQMSIVSTICVSTKWVLTK